MCLFVICIFFVEMSVQVFCPFLIGLFVSNYWLLILINVAWINALSDVFCNYFLQVYDLSFHFINDVFWRDSAFNFDKNKFVNYFSFINQDLGIISKKSLWIKKHEFFSYDFFYKFYSLDFYIRLIVHFNLFVINGIKYSLHLNWFSSIHWNDYFLSIEWYL